MPVSLMADQLSQIISQATAPAFLLGAVAGFLTVLVGRLNRILDRGADLLSIDDQDSKRLQSKKDASALIGVNHAYGSAVLFVAAMGFFAASLICLWLEVRVAVTQLDKALSRQNL